MNLDEDKKVEPTSPSPGDLACIIYPSRSTEILQGVLLSYANLAVAIAVIDSLIKKFRDNIAKFEPVNLAGVVNLTREEQPGQIERCPVPTGFC